MFKSVTVPYFIGLLKRLLTDPPSQLAYKVKVTSQRNRDC